MQDNVPSYAKVGLLHLQTMTGPYGLYQHATKRAPLLTEGYCTDDNARAVLTLIHLSRYASLTATKDVDALIALYWNFLLEAQEQPGVLYNFRDAQGAWLSQGRSDDMYARVVRACVAVINHDWNTARQAEARQLLQSLFPTLKKFSSLRGWAELLIAFSESPKALALQPSIDELVTQAWAHLKSAWQNNATKEWPWFEPVMTYSNAILPHALLKLPSGQHAEAEEILRESARFLIDTTIHNHRFIPVGSTGWYPKGQKPSSDNQQPIEAGTMLDFLLEYHVLFPDQISVTDVITPYNWFFGNNTGQVRLADPAAGASMDGLFLKGPNQNCGAESMLAYLWSETRIALAPPSIRNVAWQQRDRLLAQHG